MQMNSMSLAPRNIAALWLSLTLTACSVTPAEVRESPRDSGVIPIELPYRQVKANLERNAQRCYEGGTVAWHNTTEAREVKPGELTTINIYLKGMLGESRAGVSIDLTNTGAGSEVRYFVRAGFMIFTKWRSVIEGWATGKSTECGRLLGG
jgi:hypothetical protein